MPEPKTPASAEPKRKAHACPICRKPVDEKYKPFCSKRCADIDLHRWLVGTYAIPVDNDDNATEGEREPE